MIIIIMNNNIVFYHDNIKIYYPVNIDDINPLYKLFSYESYSLYFDKYRKINFTLEEFESVMLLQKLNNELKKYASSGLERKI